MLLLLVKVPNMLIRTLVPNHLTMAEAWIGGSSSGIALSAMRPTAT